jgi:hypothetical protein
MTYAGTHRNVKFSVHRIEGAWKYTLNNESFGQYAQWQQAIAAAIQHIDRMLIDAPSRRE